jgi:hypothetical protein
MFTSKKKKPSMSFDSLVEMANNINQEIIDNYKMGNRMVKLIFYDNSDNFGGIQYEMIFKPFKQQKSGKEF